MNVAFKQKLESIFRSVVFIIFCVTAWFAIPGTFWPHAVLDVLHIPVPRDLVWAAFAFQLVFLVSLYSLPVIFDCRRYAFNALLCGYIHIALALYWWVMYPWQNRFLGGGHGLLRACRGGCDSRIVVTHLDQRYHTGNKFGRRKSSMKSLPPQSAARLRTLCLRACYGLLIVLALIGGLVWEKFFHEYPQTLPEKRRLGRVQIWFHWYRRGRWRSLLDLAGSAPSVSRTFAWTRWLCGARDGLGTRFRNACWFYETAHRL